MSVYNLEKSKNKKKDILVLVSIIVSGFVLRIIYCPFQLPLELDAIDYMIYGSLLSEKNQFPTELVFPNNGWPSLLSLFFEGKNNDIFTLMNTQRIVSIVFSVLTIIPIYFIIKKFINSKLVFLGPILFAFEPRLVLNSTLGITEPLFLFLATLSIFFILSKNLNLNYLSFFMAGLITLVRYEGLLIILPLLVYFIIKNKNNKKIILKIILCLTIFLMVITPMSIIRIETMGFDGIFSHFIGGVNYIDNVIISALPDEDDLLYYGDPEKNNIGFFVKTGISNYFSNVLIISIPTLLLFFILTIFYFTKNFQTLKINKEKLFGIIWLISMSIPSFFAYARGINEPRYLLILYPILFLLFTFVIYKLTTNINNLKIIQYSVICFIIITSLLYLQLENSNIHIKEENFKISKEIIKKIEIINSNPIDGNFLKVSSLIDQWDIDNINFENGEIITKIKKINIDNKSLAEILEDKELTHLVIDEKNKNNFMYQIFLNEKDYDYLEKVWDSKDEGFNYHIKIFRIDYEK